MWFQSTKTGVIEPGREAQSPFQYQQLKMSYRIDMTADAINAILEPRLALNLNTLVAALHNAGLLRSAQLP